MIFGQPWCARDQLRLQSNSCSATRVSDAQGLVSQWKLSNSVGVTRGFLGALQNCCTCEN